MRSALAEHVARHVTGGQSAGAANCQHQVRVVLAHAGADGQRLGGGGADAGDAVSIGHRAIHPIVDLIRQLQAPIGSGAELVGCGLDPLISSGERRGLQ